MKSLLVLFLTAGLFVASAQKKSSSNPGTLLTQLQNDVRGAMANAELKDKDKKKLEKAVERLQKQVDNRAAGKRLDNGEIRHSVDDIRGVAKNFKEDDQRKVIATINEIHDKKLDVEKESNVKLPNQNQNKRNNDGFPNTTGRNSRSRF